MFSLNTENSLMIMITVHNVVPCHMQRHNPVSGLGFYSRVHRWQT